MKLSHHRNDDAKAFIKKQDLITKNLYLYLRNFEE